MFKLADIGISTLTVKLPDVKRARDALVPHTGGRPRPKCDALELRRHACRARAFICAPQRTDRNFFEKHVISHKIHVI